LNKKISAIAKNFFPLGRGDSGTQSRGNLGSPIENKEASTRAKARLCGERSLLQPHLAAELVTEKFLINALLSKLNSFRKEVTASVSSKAEKRERNRGGTSVSPIEVKGG